MHTPISPNTFPLVDSSLLIAMGVYPGLTGVNKFGRNSNVAIGVEEEIWDGSIAYSFPTDTTEITHVRSAVDSATTQGAVIEIEGLDVNWDLVTQTKALDGADSSTEVQLDTALRRSFRMKVLDGSVMDQDIWVGDDDFVVAAAKAIIIAGNNQTLMAMYTVPKGKAAYLTSLYVHVNPGTNLDPTSMPVRLYATDNANGYAPQVKHVIGQVDSNWQHHFDPYQEYTEKTDLYMTAQPVGKAADISAGFDLILVDM